MAQGIRLSLLVSSAKDLNFLLLGKREKRRNKIKEQIKLFRGLIQNSKNFTYFELARQII